MPVLGDAGLFHGLTGRDFRLVDGLAGSDLKVPNALFLRDTGLVGLLPGRNLSNFDFALLLDLQSSRCLFGRNALRRKGFFTGDPGGLGCPLAGDLRFLQNLLDARFLAGAFPGRRQSARR